MSHCDLCHNECNLGDCGNAITVEFPYGHPLDSMATKGLGEPNTFCSSECLMDYIVLHEITPEDVKEKMKEVDEDGSNI